MHLNATGFQLAELAGATTQRTGIGPVGVAKQAIALTHPWSRAVDSGSTQKGGQRAGRINRSMLRHFGLREVATAIYGGDDASELIANRFGRRTQATV